MTQAAAAPGTVRAGRRPGTCLVGTWARLMAANGRSRGRGRQSPARKTVRGAWHERRGCASRHWHTEKHVCMRPRGRQADLPGRNTRR